MEALSPTLRPLCPSGVKALNGPRSPWVSPSLNESPSMGWTLPEPNPLAEGQNSHSNSRHTAPIICSKSDPSFGFSATFEWAVLSGLPNGARQAGGSFLPHVFGLLRNRRWAGRNATWD